MPTSIEAIANLLNSNDAGAIIATLPEEARAKAAADVLTSLRPDVETDPQPGGGLLWGVVGYVSLKVVTIIATAYARKLLAEGVAQARTWFMTVVLGEEEYLRARVEAALAEAKSSPQNLCPTSVVDLLRILPKEQADEVRDRLVEAQCLVIREAFAHLNLQGESESEDDESAAD